jgi:hypothetical protein
VSVKRQASRDDIGTVRVTPATQVPSEALLRGGRGYGGACALAPVASRSAWGRRRIRRGCISSAAIPVDQLFGFIMAELSRSRAAGSDIAGPRARARRDRRPA